ncbi:MAG: A/G-specific adenine glycosylase, partial [Candidatus Omnitrophica bacterium]|nr:A/G-specific adenine glycosylase [Candidatus Omnitrophota bacterium]
MDELVFPPQFKALEQNKQAFQSQLISWYRRKHRKLPWRSVPCLYKTVVSEFMLQQTQVKTVVSYFERWLKTFPDFKALAQASSEKVMKHWEGLGYYARARNLHQLAKILAQQKHPPKDAASWLDYPGVGPYTAAAITSIAFNSPIAVVDGNVIRVLSRLSADRTSLAGSSDANKHFHALAQSLLNTTHPGDHNQALMELGAVICLVRNPLCGQCPVGNFCQAKKNGDPNAYPN